MRGARRVFAGGVVALDGSISWLGAGEFVAILGPSGCGKSTLLRLVAGLDRPTRGEVGRSMHARSSAFVFQDAHLLPWRTRARQRGAAARAARACARASGATARARARAGRPRRRRASAIPAQLSGGMRMRVSLARALVTRPRLLLLDEPFAALDELTRHRLDDQLRALWIDLGMTVLFVTHSITEAAYLAERAVVFSRRPARIVADLARSPPRAQLRAPRRAGLRPGERCSSRRSGAARRPDLAAPPRPRPRLAPSLAPLLA